MILYYIELGMLSVMQICNMIKWENITCFLLAILFFCVNCKYLILSFMNYDFFFAEIEEFNLIQSPNSISAKRLNSYGLKQSDLTKGFYVCPSLRNLVLNYPGTFNILLQYKYIEITCLLNNWEEISQCEFIFVQGSVFYFYVLW